MNAITAPVAAQLASQGVAFAPQIADAASRHGLDPTLLAAVAAQETGGPGSNGGANIVGDGGHGHGLFQIDDRWHDFARSAQAMDPGANAEYAAGMLSGLLNRYGGNVREALSAYNAGSPTGTGTVTTWPDGERLGYADSVLRHQAGLEPDGQAATLAYAQAEQGCTTGSVNALLALQAQLQPSAPLAPPWQPPQGYDATGHRSGTPDDYISYVNGDAGDDS